MQLAAVEPRAWLEFAHWIVLPVAGWFCRQLVHSLDVRVDAKVGQRIAESRQMLFDHIDAAFKEHEKCDQRLLLRLEECDRRLERIEAVLMRGGPGRKS